MKPHSRITSQSQLLIDRESTGKTRKRQFGVARKPPKRNVQYHGNRNSRDEKSRVRVAPIGVEKRCPLHARRNSSTKKID
jgi:hypothetical protein